MDYDDNDDFDNNNRDDGHLGLSFLLAWLNPSGHEGSFLSVPPIIGGEYLCLTLKWDWYLPLLEWWELW